MVQNIPLRKAHAQTLQLNTRWCDLTLPLIYYYYMPCYIRVQCGFNVISILDICGSLPSAARWSSQPPTVCFERAAQRFSQANAAAGNKVWHHISGNVYKSTSLLTVSLNCQLYFSPDGESRIDDQVPIRSYQVPTSATVTLRRDLHIAMGQPKHPVSLPNLPSRPTNGSQP